MQFRNKGQSWLFSKAFFALVLTVLLSACTTTSFHSKAPQYTGESPVGAIYIYSFLDLREGVLGRKFLAEVKRQLADALTKEGIRTKQFWFNDSPLAAQFALEETGTSPSNTSTRIPVGEVIKAMQEDERSFGSSHRLVVFPSSVMHSTTGSSFNIRWTLIEAQTNRVNWETISFSYHTKWFLGDENPDGRATTFVQELMAELRKANVIPAHGT